MEWRAALGFSLLVLQTVCAHTNDTGESESKVVGFPEPINGVIGDDVILPCHLEPPFNVANLTVEWSLNNSLVHVYRHRQDDPTQQDKRFEGRTSLFLEEMTKGNISLKLSRVGLLDAGHYKCSVPKLHSQVRKGYIDLTVSNRTEDKQNDSKMTGGHKGTVVIVLGVLVGLVLGVLVVVAVRRCRANQAQDIEMGGAEDGGDGGVQEVVGGQQEANHVVLSQQGGEYGELHVTDPLMESRV